MIGLVIVSHLDLAKAAHETLNHIVGDQGQLEAIGIDPDFENMDAVRDQISEAIENVNTGSGVVIFTDMFGGIPSNLSISLSNKDNVEVIAVVSQSLLQGKLTLFVDTIIQRAQQIVGMRIGWLYCKRLDLI